MGSAIAKRVFQHIQRHDGITVILVTDQTLVAATAMIPQDKQVLFSTVVLPGPLDKIGKRPVVRHAGFFRLVHQDKSVFCVAPALQFVIGDLESKFFFGIPILCAARLNQNIHALMRKRGSNGIQVCCRSAIN